MDEFLNETADEYGEVEFDNEFNQIILSVDTCVNERTIWDTTLPQGFDVEVIISKLKYDDPLTQIVEKHIITPINADISGHKAN
jgi:hypothetical protein